MRTVCTVNEGRSLRSLLVGAAAAAAVFYAAGFGLNEHLRWRRGPWQVRFEPGNEPRLVVDQPRLGIAGFTLSFPGETADGPPMTIRFESPRQPLPFGSVVYDDLTYLPGVVTLDLFGHEIELLPRTLYVNRRPVPWTTGNPVVVSRGDSERFDTEARDDSTNPD